MRPPPRTPTLRFVAVGIALLSGAVAACAGLMGVEDASLDPSSLEAGAGDEVAVQPGTGKADDDSGSFVPDSGCVGAGCSCGVDNDCRDSLYKKCVDGKCQGCSITPTDSCPVGRYCLAGSADSDSGAAAYNECAPGCRTADDCVGIPNAKFCIAAQHRCVQCTQKSDCAGAQDCSPSGVCSDICTPDGGGQGSCTNATQRCCGGFCIDPNLDPLNCGRCTNPCAAGSLCCTGTCANPLNSVQNCGKCGTACSTANATPSCTAGSCKWTCNNGFHHCTPADQNTGCETATSANATKCGGCNIDCNATVVHATGVACASSRCDYANCQQGFINADSNRATGCETPCGANNQACCPSNTCNSGLVCQSGVCKSCGNLDEACCPQSKCSTNLYCGSDSICHTCKSNNQGCVNDVECCAGGATNCQTPPGKCR
jgi:hypothetical protein